MNKKEFIKTLIDMGGCGARGWDEAIEDVIVIAKELDESEQTDTNVGLSKPVIPQFVADYIEQSKKDNDSINQLFTFIDDKENKELWNWLFPSISDEKRINQEMFMRAWLDGYEVEEGKKYFIKEPVTGQFLIRDFKSIGVKWVDGFSTSPSYFTEIEIKAIDKRFWAFAEEVTE